MSQMDLTEVHPEIVSTPVAASNDSTVDASLRVSGSASSADSTNCKVFATGYNVKSMLCADGTEKKVASPAQCTIPSQSKVIAVSGGFAHTLFVLADGTAWAVGSNRDGQLGDGTFVDRETPVQVQGLENVVAACANNATTNFFSLFLRSDGVVFACGNNSCGQIGVSTSGLGHSESVSQSGSQGGSCSGSEMGDNDSGYSRSGASSVSMTSNVAVVHTTPAERVLRVVDAVAIAAGNAHSVFLTRSGQVMITGATTYIFTTIQEPLRVSRFVTVPARVKNLDGVKQIATGGGHTVCVHQDGTVSAFGLNASGQIGNGVEFEKLSAPKPVPAPKKLADGTLVVKKPAQPEKKRSIAKVDLRSSSKVRQVACGMFHTLYLLEDGTVRSAGYNECGCLGNGRLENTAIPSMVVFSPKSTKSTPFIEEIGAGAMHSVFRSRDGVVFSCGSNSYGVLGDGTLSKARTDRGSFGLAMCGMGIAMYFSALTVVGLPTILRQMKWFLRKYGAGTPFPVSLEHRLCSKVSCGPFSSYYVCDSENANTRSESRALIAGQ